MTMPWSQTTTLFEQDERKPNICGTTGDAIPGASYFSYPYGFAPPDMHEDLTAVHESPYRPALQLDPQTVNSDFARPSLSVPMPPPPIPFPHMGGGGDGQGFSSDGFSLSSDAAEQVLTPGGTHAGAVAFGYSSAAPPYSVSNISRFAPASSPFETPQGGWVPHGHLPTGYFNNNNNNYNHNFSTAPTLQDGSYFSTTPAHFPYVSPPFPHQQQQQQQGYIPLPSNGHMPPSPAFGTISPAQLPRPSLPDIKPSLSFTEMMREPRTSPSSASSATDGGAGGSGQDVILEDWARPMQHALQIDLSLATSVSSLESTASSFHAHARRLSSGPTQQSVNPSSSQWATRVPPPDGPMSAGDGSIESLMAQYAHSTNRFATGERKVVIMTPRVGQKSYGTEKRFLCPHPQVTLIGNTWWHGDHNTAKANKLLPPVVNVSLTGEERVRDSTISSWLSVDNVSLDAKLSSAYVSASDRPFYGTIPGKNLHISDKDGCRKALRAIVTVKAPRGDAANSHPKPDRSNGDDDEVICELPSKEIRVISKPSKKKTSMKPNERKNNDLTISHGSTIALFNRIKSQTTTTRFLSVQPDLSCIVGSDGQPVPGAAAPSTEPRTSSAFPGLAVSATVWESFIIWLVNPARPTSIAPGPPMHPDYPPTPANAIIPGVLNPLIRYNSTVVLQSLQTGMCSPTLVIRRIDQQSGGVTGGDGTSPGPSIACPEGEFPGDMVSQLHKVAFEVYQPHGAHNAVMSNPSTISAYLPLSSTWLACDAETVLPKTVDEPRHWATLPPSKFSPRPGSAPTTPLQRQGVMPMTPHKNNNQLPSMPASPTSTGSSMGSEQLGAGPRRPPSPALFSPSLAYDMSLPTAGSGGTADGGPIRHQRTGSISRPGPLTRPTHKKRASHDSSTITTATPGQWDAQQNRQFWTLNVGENALWTIVSTESVTYTFFLAPPNPQRQTVPVGPLPIIHKVIPPDALSARESASTYGLKLDPAFVTLSGKNFLDPMMPGRPYNVWYGDQPAAHNEIKSSEIMAVAPPSRRTGQSVPMFLVRHTGDLIVPTDFTYPA